MKKLLVRWIISALSLFVAAWLLPGIEVRGTAWLAYAVMAVVLGFANAVIRPILKLLTCPLIILTLGLFTLVINGLTLWLSAELSTWLAHALGLNVGYHVRDFWSALLGAIIVSVVTVILSTLFVDKD
ncbi:MAG TPA: phage holin family protein [Thermoflexia bacterium]|jgi:putative membrane protein|nr:phage holin family protein [Thermoflexia bacterium]